GDALLRRQVDQGWPITESIHPWLTTAPTRHVRLELLPGQIDAFSFPTLTLVLLAAVFRLSRERGVQRPLRSSLPSLFLGHVSHIFASSGSHQDVQRARCRRRWKSEPDRSLYGAS